MRILQEDNNTRFVHIYKDEPTGKRFVSYDGVNLEELPDVEPAPKMDPEFLKEIKKQREEQIRSEGGYIETPEEAQQRIERSKAFLMDKKFHKDLLSHEDKLRQRREDKKREKRVADAKNKPGNSGDFIRDLVKTVKSQIADREESSYGRYNPRGEGSGLLLPSHYNLPTGKIPVINVYVDQSGSWSDRDVAVANEYLDRIRKYEQKGKIALNVRYFSENVWNTASEARAEGGTELQPVLDDIESTTPRPLNVIIFTDSDSSHASFDHTVVVPGKVWLLWKNGHNSPALANSVRGRRDTKQYNI